MFSSRDIVRLVSLALLVSSTLAKGASYIGPTPDFGFPDNPSFEYFYLEDFEDGALNTLGVQSSVVGSVISGSFADSVEPGGRSFYSGTNSVSFRFDGGVLPRLPTHVGWVWTDVGDVQGGGPIGFGQVQFEAFGPNGESLGIHGPFDVGDGLFSGQVAEDRFLGIVSVVGISSITITMPNSADWEMDDLQYGAAPVPVPAGIWLLISGLLPLVGRRRGPLAGR